MPLKTPVSEAGRLTAATRAEQAASAAKIAALVAVYYRTWVDVDDPSSVLRWLDIMIPRILKGHDDSGRLAARYAETVRRIELPSAPKLSFDARPGAVAEQIGRSLQVVGPTSFVRERERISSLDLPPSMKKAQIARAKETSTRKVVGSVVRHVQSGGRATIEDIASNDLQVIGYVRVTKDRPCYFCAMLASRGVVGSGGFTETSFDASDPRFLDGKVIGTAKVHDSCACHLKPVYSLKDDYVERSSFFEDLWYELSTGSGGEAIRTFRNGYNRWLQDNPA